MKLAPLKLFDGARPVGGRRAAVRDALAGITLASMNVPQLLGYARIAGMPLVTGLYTAASGARRLCHVWFFAAPRRGRGFRYGGDPGGRTEPYGRARQRALFVARRPRPHS